jgi:hypothetical protein
MKTSLSKTISVASVVALTAIASLQDASAFGGKGSSPPPETYRYIARFKEPVTSPLIAFNMVWQCSKFRCSANAPSLISPLPVCQNVAQTTGNTVTRFLVRKEDSRLQLTASELKECNE